jgi:hypothetical protein
MEAVALVAQGLAQEQMERQTEAVVEVVNMTRQMRLVLVVLE